MAGIRSPIVAVAAASGLAFLITPILAALIGANPASLSPANWRAGGASVAWAAPSADASTTLVVIDAPQGGTTGTQLEVRGWSADRGAPSGTGVDRVEVYLDGERDAGGTRLGQATYGLQRPDVAAHLGSQQFLLSGFALRTTVEPGPHTIYVYAHPSDQPADQGWAPPKQSVVMAAPGAGPPSTASLPGPTGAITYGFPGIGSYYPPGPADSGGPLYAPLYYGYGLYGGPPPFPDVPYYASAYTVPPWFDFSLSASYDLYGLGYWAVPRSLGDYGGYGLPFYPYGSGYYLNRYPDYFFDYTLPGYLRGGRYCPLYSAMVC